ncbi:MAG: class I SAM-dependent methyltransferase, partial [Bacteroidota bacterium]
MRYDPVKSTLGNFFNSSPFMRIFFYRLLNTLLLRTWYVKKEIRSWNRKKFKIANILDAGCGFGQYSYSLSNLKKHFNISAIDISPDHVADCNTFFRKIDKHNIHFAQADLTTFSNPD